LPPNAAPRRNNGGRSAAVSGGDADFGEAAEAGFFDIVEFGQGVVDVLALLAQILTLLGYGDLARSQDLAGILPQKLLLDGLVSVWQVGHD